VRGQDIGPLIGYMYWVNHRLLDAASRLPPERFAEPTMVTTRDLRATLVHELDVEWSWRLRLRDRSEAEFGPEAELRPEDYPDVASLRDHWARDEAEMLDWLGSLSDEDLERPPASALSRDRRPLWEYLVHIITHAGQQQADAATLLTLAGASPGDNEFLDYVDPRD
jgi:uncharacterized damage-inducible protein DinB